MSSVPCRRSILESGMTDLLWHCHRSISPAHVACPQEARRAVVQWRGVPTAAGVHPAATFSHRPCRISGGLLYSPGIMRCAVDVPAFMIQTPPTFGLSGNPIDCVVAPGTAMVMCVRAVAWSCPSGDTRRIRIRAWRGCRPFPRHRVRLPLGSVRLRLELHVLRGAGRLSTLVHSSEYGSCPGSPDLSKQTMRLVPFLSVSWSSRRAST